MLENNSTTSETPLAPLPASGTPFDMFMKFAATPTTHDGKDVDTSNTDFEDIDPETGLKTTSNAPSGTTTPAPANNASNSGQMSQPVNTPAPIQSQAVRSDALALVKGFDFLHGILLNFIAELTPEEEANRKFRAKEKELNEMGAMLSQIMIEDSMSRINPKWILMLMFLSVYVERSISAVRDKKAKQRRRKERENIYSDDNSIYAPVNLETEKKTKTKTTVQPSGKRSNGLLGKKRGSYNKSK